MSRYALYVPLEAQPGKEAEVAEFLRSAVPLVNAEPGTVPPAQVEVLSQFPLA